MGPYFTTASQPHAQLDTMTFPPLDSGSSTPQLIPSPAFESSPSPFTHSQSNNMSSPTLSNLPSPTLHGHHHQPSGLVQCKWGGCYATFTSLGDLVGHVNLQHLRLPASTATLPPTFDSSAYISQNAAQMFSQQQLPIDSSLSCLWSDCHIYPDGQPVPGPSSGDPFAMLDVLASHLLRDHLGVNVPPPSMTHDTQHFFAHGVFPPSQSSPVDPLASSSTATTPTAAVPSAGASGSGSTSSPPAGGPPTPTPEHDCASPAAHVCRWTGCGQSFASCDALTEHIAALHVGGGRAHYDCFWEGCGRNGDAGFASKQKISRHMQVRWGRWLYASVVLTGVLRRAEPYGTPAVPVQGV